jgi:hypothetical protein
VLGEVAINFDGSLVVHFASLLTALQELASVAENDLLEVVVAWEEAGFALYDGTTVLFLPAFYEAVRPGKVVFDLTQDE